MSITVSDIRRKYLEFMVGNGHTVIPSASLVPENDPTTLFTGSGMQPLIPFLMGESHPEGTRLVNSQKCFRAEDIDEVGDNRHTTFFEMLGNWSLGDYFKEEQLTWFFEFLTKEVGLAPEKLYVSVYQGDEENRIPKDEESAKLWQKLFASVGVSNQIADIGSEDMGYVRGIKEGERIFYYNSKNWWSRTGVPAKMPVGEIGGGDSEVFFDFGTNHDTSYGEHCHPNCDCGRFLEIGNSVFMEYIKTESGFEKLPKQNVDFGGGLERIAAVANGNSDVFLVDELYTVIIQLEKLTGKSYTSEKEAFRVIADHIRGATFMINDGVSPSNSEQGYFVRRLLRRAVRFADKLGLAEGELSNLSVALIDKYKGHYVSLLDNRESIVETIAEEEKQFRKTLENGLKQFNRISLSVDLKAKSKPDENYKVPIKVGGRTVYIEESQRAKAKKGISGSTAFELFTTYGFPIELTEEIASERGLLVDRKGFEKLMQEHKERSRAGAEQKFKGGLADHSKKVVQYHTSTHLLLAALRKLVGPHIHQAGSNITGERLRFDFTHPDKIERFKLDELETWVNNAIQTGGSVTTETMPKEKAQADPTIEGSFWDRYPDQVKVYTVVGNEGTVFSRELCGGPHVSNMNEIEGTFKIKKEESSSAGVRRIKAILE
jgi:alanyl-tRNA synthetase